MAPIDRNILRLALFEFIVDGQTPVKVAINEAVELAKIFGSDSAPRFVNGVLGSLAGENLSITPSQTQVSPNK
jgi:N utilization substance protein B